MHRTENLVVEEAEDTEAFADLQAELEAEEAEAEAAAEAEKSEQAEEGGEQPDQKEQAEEQSEQSTMDALFDEIAKGGKIEEESGDDSTASEEEAE